MNVARLSFSKVGNAVFVFFVNKLKVQSISREPDSDLTPAIPSDFPLTFKSLNLSFQAPVIARLRSSIKSSGRLNARQAPSDIMTSLTHTTIQRSCLETVLTYRAAMRAVNIDDRSVTYIWLGEAAIYSVTNIITALKVNTSRGDTAEFSLFSSLFTTPANPVCQHSPLSLAQAHPLKT